MINEQQRVKVAYTMRWFGKAQLVILVLFSIGTQIHHVFWGGETAGRAVIAVVTWTAISAVVFAICYYGSQYIEHWSKPEDEL